MWPIQKLIQLLNAKDEESLPLRVKQRIGAMIRVVLPKWPGLSGIILRLCTTFGHPLVLCDVEGVQLLVDSRDKAVGHYLLNAIAYEPEELDLLRKCLKPGANFLDIGGNIGYFTIIAAKHVGPLGKVIAFEPEPHNFEILRRNVELNKLRNVMIENYAAVDQEKTLTLYLSATRCCAPEKASAQLVTDKNRVQSRPENCIYFPSFLHTTSIPSLRSWSAFRHANILVKSLGPCNESNCAPENEDSAPSDRGWKI